MDAIGGYFELELRHGEHYHKDAIRLNTARNCFEYVLIARKYRKVYIPYYTCEVMLQPLRRQHVEYAFYSIDWNLEPIGTFRLEDGEAFLYTNYFGIKQDCVEKLAKVYGSRLIVDNAQAFYAPRIDGIDTFYSPRKFFGVPDGGYLYTDCRLEEELPQDTSYERMAHLLIRADKDAETGYSAFRENEDKLDNAPIMRMSKLTERLLSNIDYRFAAHMRRMNFEYLDSLMKSSNKLSLSVNPEEIPLVYPYLTECSHMLRSLLIDGSIYVATYWPNVLEWCNKEDAEHKLTGNVIPLPIDQRYGEEEIKRMLVIIQKKEYA